MKNFKCQCFNIFIGSKAVHLSEEVKKTEIGNIFKLTNELLFFGKNNARCRKQQ